MSSRKQTDNKARKSSAADFIPANSENVAMFADQVLDNLMHVVIALGAEHWTVRRRLLTLESVLRRLGVSSEDIEKYQPSEAEEKAWEAERDIFIKRTFSALERRGGADIEQFDMSEDV